MKTYTTLDHPTVVYETEIAEYGINRPAARVPVTFIEYQILLLLLRNSKSDTLWNLWHETLRRVMTTTSYLKDTHITLHDSDILTDFA